MFSHPNLTLAVRLKNKVELEKSNSVPEKAPPFCTYDKIFDMKQKRLNGHKLSKVEPPIKAKRTSEKKTETERKIDILLHTVLYPQIWKSSNGSDKGPCNWS